MDTPIANEEVGVLLKQGTINLLNLQLVLITGCFYQLSPINLVSGPLKCSKSNFNPVHVFLHFKSFCLVILKLILASKLSELQQFENLAENGLFMNNIAFSGIWRGPMAKCKKGDPI